VVTENTTSKAEKMQQEIERDDDGLVDATGTSGFSEDHIFLV